MTEDGARTLSGKSHAPRRAGFTGQGSRGLIELAVLDVDGTIIANHGPPTVSESVVEAVRATRDAGIAVTLATGRTLDYVRAHLAGPLGLTTPVITAQGAVVGDPVTGAILARTSIPRRAAHRAAAVLDDLASVAVLYLLDERGRTTMLQRGGPTGADHDDLFGTPRSTVASLASALGRHSAEALKLIAEAPLDADQAAVATEIAARIGPGLQVARTHPRLVEVTAAGVDKGQGLRDLCRILGVSASRVLAVGDNDNDVPMLEVAGIGVALANGSPAAREAADWVAPPFSADGAAEALRRFTPGRFLR